MIDIFVTSFDNIAEDHFYLAVTLLSVVILYCCLKVVRKCVRWLFLSPEEKTMSKKLRELTILCKTKLNECDRLENEIRSRTNTVRNSDSSVQEVFGRIKAAENTLIKVQDQITAERKTWIEQKAKWVKDQANCFNCGSTYTSLYCGNCGVRQKSTEVAYEDVDFSIVNEYLHSIACWGKPLETNGGIVLPWPSKESIKFTVGDVSYNWGKEESDDVDGEWWATLEWEHPILGNLKLTNKIQGDNEHCVCHEDSDNTYEMTSGSLDEIERLDIEIAVRQSLTALYLWLKSERKQP